MCSGGIEEEGCVTGSFQVPGLDDLVFNGARDSLSSKLLGGSDYILLIQRYNFWAWHRALHMVMKTNTIPTTCQVLF